MNGRRSISAALVLLGGLIAGASGPARAQTPFALTNVGQKVDTEDARMAGRGGWGMTVADSTNPGFKNTAGLSEIRQVAISLVGTGVEGTADDGVNSRTQTRVSAPDFRMALPVLKGRLAFTAGFSMDRSFRYETVREYTTYVRGDTLSGVERFLRKGTLYQVPVGVAWKVIPSFSLGADLRLVRGTLNESLYEAFVAPVASTGAPFYGTVLRVQNDEFEGTAFNFSALYRYGDHFRLGASWTPAYDVDADRELSLSGLTARYTETWSMTMPDEYLVGGQARLHGRWFAGADYQLQKFSEFEGPAGWLAAGMEDETTISVGIERRMDYIRRGGLANWPIRMGYSQRQWAYRVGGNPITEDTFSVGTGFPFRGQLGVLDLALSYSMIGEQAENGLEDSVWKMTVSVSGLERWW